jgi:branched-chain amino acid transport system substrate-binding protein
VKEVVDESITVGDQDFTALVSKLKQARVEAIFFGGYRKEAALIVRQAREQGLTATLISDSALPTPEFWAIAGASGEGTLFTFASPQPRPRASRSRPTPRSSSMPRRPRRRNRSSCPT